MDAVKWSVVGTGYIANRFARGMNAASGAVLDSVVSRSMSSARSFAERHGALSAYDDIDRMLSEREPDIVYVAIPNDLHYDLIKKLLNAGKNVLSEKPMTDNTAQMEELFAIAKGRGLFLMEGMWTRCFPAVRKVRQWLSEGRIGEPLSVNVMFDIRPDRNDWQLWKAGREHSAGALRDVGIYSLAVANMVFSDEPRRIMSVMSSNGDADECFRMLLDWGNGRFASLGGAFDRESDHAAHITGTEGRISFGPEFWDPEEACLIRNDGSKETFSLKFPETGFQYEIEAVQKALRENSTECADFTHKESLLISRLIENTRKEWGILYRSDK